MSWAGVAPSQPVTSGEAGIPALNFLTHKLQEDCKRALISRAWALELNDSFKSCLCHFQPQFPPLTNEGTYLLPQVAVRTAQDVTLGCTDQSLPSALLVFNKRTNSKVAASRVVAGRPAVVAFRPGGESVRISGQPSLCLACLPSQAVKIRDDILEPSLSRLQYNEFPINGSAHHWS